MLLITGLILFIPLIFKAGDATAQNLGLKKIFLIGVLQALAIIPGISRSGTTISAGLALGLSSKAAGEYSFLISIPVILGASILKLPELAAGARHFSIVQMIVGTFVAFLSGLIALKFLLMFVKRGRLHVFSVYCFLAGGIGLMLFL